ncbi:MAG: YiiX family permuted papain-like enzyme [Bacteroidia bacterium]
MKKIVILLSVLIIAILGICAVSETGKSKNNFKTGDIIFIISSSGQGKAIQLATKSKYTHVGMIFREGDQTYVYHAVEPVMKSTLDDFISFSEDGKYVVKRLKDPLVLSPGKNAKMLEMAKALLGKHYDIYFNWKDDEWYCSEFVWKLYQRTYGIEVGKLRPLKDFDLSSQVVKDIMAKRYGSDIPLTENMISPGDMFNSELLVEVK